VLKDALVEHEKALEEANEVTAPVNSKSAFSSRSHTPAVTSRATTPPNATSSTTTTTSGSSKKSILCSKLIYQNNEALQATLKDIAEQNQLRVFEAHVL